MRASDMTGAPLPSMPSKKSEACASASKCMLRVLPDPAEIPTGAQDIAVPHLVQKDVKRRVISFWSIKLNPGKGHTSAWYTREEASPKEILPPAFAHGYPYQRGLIRSVTASNDPGNLSKACC